MSGRQRDIGRTFASGSSKRKGKEEKEKRHQQSLPKMPKITNLFRPVDVGACAASSESESEPQHHIQTEEVTYTLTLTLASRQYGIVSFWIGGGLFS